MQILADNAVSATRDKFGVSLDFTENSWQQNEKKRLTLPISAI
jgi:hypothetical protein